MTPHEAPSRLMPPEAIDAVLAEFNRQVKEADLRQNPFPGDRRAKFRMPRQKAAVAVGADKPQVNSLIEVKTYCYFNQQLGINTSHWQCTRVVGTGATYVQCAFSFGSRFGLDYPPSQVTASFFYGVTLVELSPTGSVEFADWTHKAAGQVAGHTLPTQCCGLIRRLSTATKRSGKGRLYIPFVPASFTTDGLSINAGGNAVYTQLAADYQQQIDCNVAQDPNNFSSFNPVLYNQEFGTISKIVQTTPSAWIATQRRRGDFGKINAPPGFVV